MAPMPADLFFFLLLIITTTTANAAEIDNTDTGVLYPFGKENGDNALPYGDDLYVEAQLPISFPYGTEHHKAVFINLNGALSFVDGIGKYSSLCGEQTDDNKRIVAPFWADIQTEHSFVGGDVFYRVSDNAVLLTKVTDDITAHDPDVGRPSFKWMVVATWVNVTHFGAKYCSGNLPRNTFQAVIVTDGNISFAIFNYNLLEWVSWHHACNIDAATGSCSSDAVEHLACTGYHQEQLHSVGDGQEISNGSSSVAVVGGGGDGDGESTSSSSSDPASGGRDSSSSATVAPSGASTSSGGGDAPSQTRKPRITFRQIVRSNKTDLFNLVRFRTSTHGNGNGNVGQVVIRLDVQLPPTTTTTTTPIPTFSEMTPESTTTTTTPTEATATTTTESTTTVTTPSSSPPTAGQEIINLSSSTTTTTTTTTATTETTTESETTTTEPPTPSTTTQPVPTTKSYEDPNGSCWCCQSPPVTSLGRQLYRTFVCCGAPGCTGTDEEPKCANVKTHYCNTVERWRNITEPFCDRDFYRCSMDNETVKRIADGQPLQIKPYVASERTKKTTRKRPTTTKSTTTTTTTTTIPTTITTTIEQTTTTTTTLEPPTTESPANLTCWCCLTVWKRTYSCCSTPTCRGTASDVRCQNSLTGYCERLKDWTDAPPKCIIPVSTCESPYSKLSTEEAFTTAPMTTEEPIGQKTGITSPMTSNSACCNRCCSTDTKAQKCCNYSYNVQCGQSCRLDCSDSPASDSSCPRE